MNVLLSSIGSRGDVQPLLALALELQSLGHTATLCVAPNFKEWVESRGLRHVSLGPDVRTITTQAAGTKWKRPSREQAREMVSGSAREQLQVLGEAARGCDLLVAATLLTAGRSVAESLKIPYVYVAFCPVTLPSPAHPPPMVPPQSLPRLVNRVLWRANDLMWNRIFRGAVNEHRARLGLEPIRDMSRHMTTERPWLAADAALSPAGPSRDLQVTQTGAWFLPDPTPLPPELERFLGEGEPPVYFGLGSAGVSPEKGRLFVEAARRSGRRVLISRGWVDQEQGAAGKDCLVIGDVSHERLFPRVAAVVHHGGAGTTTAAARAGTPQVVLPMMFDQFYFGHRVKTLGAGAVGPSARRVTLEGLLPALKKALEPGTAEAARALASRIRPDGARQAAEQLVRTFGSITAS